MIEEIAAVVIPFFSLFTSNPPQLSRENLEEASLISDCEKNERLWSDKIHREYQHDYQPRLTYNLLFPDYTSDNSELNGRTLCQSLRRSLQVNIIILLSLFPLCMAAITFLYFELNTHQLCFQWQHDNKSIPFAVMRWRLVGVGVEIVLINLWFPLSMVLLFGWKEFKSNYMSTLYLCFLGGIVAVLYNTFAIIYGVHSRTLNYHKIPNLTVLFLGFIFGSMLVARKYCTVRPSVVQSSYQISFQISFVFIATSIFSIVCRYVVVPLFNEQENKIYKGILAAFAPAIAVLPAAICEYLVLRRNSENFQPGRSFVLVYILEGGGICVYRIMQADFKNIWWFISLSLLHGVLKLTRNATRRLREKVWSRLVKVLKNTFCCKRLQEIPQDTPHRRRFKADIDIQGMLFQYTTLVLSHGYLVLYRITSFDVSAWPVVEEACVRIAVGLAIDFVFNWLSVFVEIHWYDIPIRMVWLKFWKRHVFANMLILVEIVAYFSAAFLSVFQSEMDNSMEQFIKKNCTLPPVSF